MASYAIAAPTTACMPSVAADLDDEDGGPLRPRRSSPTTATCPCQTCSTPASIAPVGHLHRWPASTWWLRPRGRRGLPRRPSMAVRVAAPELRMRPMSPPPRSSTPSWTDSARRSGRRPGESPRGSGARARCAAAGSTDPRCAPRVGVGARGRGGHCCQWGRLEVEVAALGRPSICRSTPALGVSINGTALDWLAAGDRALITQRRWDPEVAVLQSRRNHSATW